MCRGMNKVGFLVRCGRHHPFRHHIKRAETKYSSGRYFSDITPQHLILTLKSVRSHTILVYSLHMLSPAAFEIGYLHARPASTKGCLGLVYFLSRGRGLIKKG